MAPKHPKNAIIKTIDPATIRTIGGPIKSLVVKCLKSETSLRTKAPAIIIPNPDIWNIKS